MTTTATEQLEAASDFSFKLVNWPNLNLLDGYAEVLQRLYDTQRPDEIRTCSDATVVEPDVVRGRNDGD